MKSSKKNIRKRKRRLNPLFVVGLGIALTLGGTWSYQLYNIDQSMEVQKAELLSQKQQLTTKNDGLRKEIEQLNTPSYVEQLAREKLGLVRKGEILIAPKESE